MPATKVITKVFDLFLATLRSEIWTKECAMTSDPEKERKPSSPERPSEPVQWQTNDKNLEPGRGSRDVETEREEQPDNLR